MTSQLVAAHSDLASAVGRREINEPLTYAVLNLRAGGIYAVDLARAAGMGASVLSRLQNGHQQPTVEQATRLAELLGRPVAELFPDLDPANESDSAEPTPAPSPKPPSPAPGTSQRVLRAY
jgi:transcriptional regulator with XRE-family HTH domain